MNGRRIALFWVVVMVFGGGWAVAQLYNRAPDTHPGLLPEMNKPSYWISRMKNPDQVILTPAAIQRPADYEAWCCLA